MIFPLKISRICFAVFGYVFEKVESEEKDKKKKPRIIIGKRK